jgi:hypothetical protein
MNKYLLLHLFWLMPLYLAFIVFQQLSVYNGTQKTYSDGATYNAEVVDFDIKQIAAQSNGYVVIRFTPDNGDPIQRRLSLSVQIAQQVMDQPLIPVRYLKGAYPEIVMIPAYELQRSIAMSNATFAGLGLLITALVAFFASRYAVKLNRKGAEQLLIERVDE